jgi:hypothetical protein
MASTIQGYGNFIKNLLINNIPNLQDEGVVVRCALLDESFSLDQTHEFWSDISSTEITGKVDYDLEGHYGQQDLINKQVIYDDVAGTITFDADNISFGSEVTIAARYMAIYEVEATPEESPLLLLVDFGELKSSLDGRFEVNWHADGIFYISI